ncbi:hypothetical protein J2752_002547 [Halarchaeum rubridurum]|uniref:Uncharacterized protein n=1 Tax=Halarchaeum rubridurum TaxID=489911 RepID=A0A830G5V9_9EURY|nr:hypothetical protein [Halarchaeum rubridurum]MBP1955624.1 hypothetical protein [Halarchaeum rubridurum]GGM76549.1 hypothetical protein GCM10009017_27840 [Halarchaeum rubridurum]
MAVEHRPDGTSDGDTLVATVREHGAALRGCWTFDTDGHETRYLRGDVADAMGATEVERYVENERYAFVTHDTYDRIHPASFRYTVRGYDGFEVFRLVFDDRVGVLCSFDGPSRRDYGALADALDTLADGEHERFAPE